MTNQNIDQDTFSNQKIKQGSVATGAATLTLQTYCENIQKQPLPSFDGLQGKKDFPDVAAHLKATHAHAGNYIDVIQPQLLSAITDITGYANQFDVFSLGIINALEHRQKHDAIVLMEQLLADLEVKRGNIAASRTALVGFRENIIQDVSLLNSDILKIESLIAADKKLAPGLKKEAENLNGKIGGATAGVVISSLAIGAGTIGLLIGPLFPPAGLVGCVLLVGGISGVVASAVSLKALTNQKKLLLSQAEAASKESLVLEDIKNNIKNVNDQLTGATVVTRNLENGWIFLEEHMNNVLTDLKNGKTSQHELIAKMWVNTARKDWLEVKKSANSTQQMLQTVKVNKTDTEISGDDVMQKAA